MSVDQAALSIIRIANATMAKGISVVSVERGYDLRDFILIPFGGAAANHAVAIARELNMGTVVVPNLCGNLSALGLVVADIVHDYVRTVGLRAADVQSSTLADKFREMEAEAVAQLHQEHVRGEDVVLEWSADLRYEGQSWELTRRSGGRPSWALRRWRTSWSPSIRFTSKRTHTAKPASRWSASTSESRPSVGPPA